MNDELRSGMTIQEAVLCAVEHGSVIARKGWEPHPGKPEGMTFIHRKYTSALLWVTRGDHPGQWKLWPTEFRQSGADLVANDWCELVRNPSLQETRYYPQPSGECGP